MADMNTAPETLEAASVGRCLFQEMAVQKLEASQADDGSVVVKHVKVQEADAVNRNGRVYPLPVLQREVSKMKEELARRPGAVDHPEGFAVPLQSLGLLWTDVYIEGNEVFGDFKIIGTQAGRDLEAIISAGVEVGISSRGYGTSKRGEFKGEQVLVIQEDYELVTFDAVTDPSVFDARIPAKSVESFDINSLLANEALVEQLTGLIVKRIQENTMSDKNQAAAAEATASAEQTAAESVAAGVAGDAAVLGITGATTAENPLDKPEVQAATTTTPEGEIAVMATPQESVEGEQANAEAPAEEAAEAPGTPATEEAATDTEEAVTEGEQVEEHAEEQCVVCEAVCEAIWTTKYVDSLPDDSFAVPGQRKLPYKDANGNIDKAHVRNALARLDQTQGLSDDEKATAKRKLVAAAKKVGINVSEDESLRLASAEVKAEIMAETLSNFEPVRQALMALAALITQEMAEGDFCDATMLASLADQLSHWADWEAIEADFEKDGESDSAYVLVDLESFKTNLGGFVEGFKKMVRAVSQQTLEDYIAKKIESGNPAYAAKVNAFLKERCSSKADVDAKYEDAVALAKSLFEDIEPAGKGVVSDPVHKPAENPRLAENARLAQQGYVTQ